MLVALLIVSALLAVAGLIVLSDVGQLLRIGKRTVVAYFRYHNWVIGLSVLLFAAAIVLNIDRRTLPAWAMVLFGVFLFACFLGTKYLVPYVLFRAKQHNAEYIAVGDDGLDRYLAPGDLVYVVEHGGVARAFPPKYLWVSHIFGGNFGGQEIVLTYCVLTNLPVPYVNDLEGKAMDLKVLAQTNNNLLLWDTRSGEIVQQMTSTCELSNRRLEPVPVVEMTWGAFESLYPGGEVLFNPYSNPIERVLNWLMPLEAQHAAESWMFRTVSLADDRLPSKEKIIGVAHDGEAVAYTRGYLREQGIVNTRVGGRSIVIAYLPEHDVVVAFDRMRDGHEVEVTEVDFHGNTSEHGRLPRTFLYNGPMWAVWLHYHPGTELFR